MKILVIDNDKLVARLMQSKFEKWGHNVVVLHDGKEAYDLIRREPFRMIIMEWELPGMSGPEICSAVRKMKRSRYCYIVFYTSKTDKDSLMAGLEAGADVYLTKPLNTIELWLRMKNGKRLLNLEDELREGPGADQVTGAVNRASFRGFFRVIMAESKRTKTTGSLFFVTVKNYNTTFTQFGYAPAQSLMIETAKLLEANTRESDLLARLSEHEFCMLLQNTHWDKCRVVVEKIYQQLSNITVYFEDMSLGVDFVIEIVDYPHGDMRYDVILDQGERLLYEPEIPHYQEPAAGS